MKKYKVTAVSVTIITGRLELTEQQAARRAYALHTLRAATDKKPGLYEPTMPVCFKRGEVLGYDGAASKALMHEMEETETLPLGKPKAEPKPQLFGLLFRSKKEQEAEPAAEAADEEPQPDAPAAA